jgi:regulator of cell morphogenesis and NO signaling
MKSSEQLPIVAGTTTLGGLVAERPQTAAVFERLGLDYCCGGQQTLEEACRSRDLDPETVATLLATLETDMGTAPEGAHELGTASISEICDHIVEVHHGPLRDELPRISELMAKVERAHGADDPEVIELAELFGRTRAELEEHMLLEEDSLFPACRAVAEDASGSGPDEELLEQLTDTHQEAGAALKRMRELSHDYRPERAHCTTHRVLMHEMHEFELDLHRHIHEENNILFPKVREFGTSQD